MFGWFSRNKDKYNEVLEELLNTDLSNIYRRVEYNCTLHVVGVDCQNGIDELYSANIFLIPKRKEFRDWYKVNNVIPDDIVIYNYIKGLQHRYRTDNSKIVISLIDSIAKIIKELE